MGGPLSADPAVSSCLLSGLHANARAPGQGMDLKLQGRHFSLGKAYSTLSNVRVPTMVWPVREKVSGDVLIVRFVPLISK
jgi:hypothetical protein